MIAIMTLCIPTIMVLMRAEKGIGRVFAANTGKGMRNSENLPGRVSMGTLMRVAAGNETVAWVVKVEENEAEVKVATEVEDID